MSEQQAPRLFDIAGVVNYLHGVGATAASATFVRALIGSGQLPHVKIGKAFYVSKASVDSWLLKSERRTRG